jgi:hypothetical protein
VHQWAASKAQPCTHTSLAARPICLLHSHHGGHTGRGLRAPSAIAPHRRSRVGAIVATRRKGPSVLYASCDAHVEHRVAYSWGHTVRAPSLYEDGTIGMTSHRTGAHPG